MPWIRPMTHTNRNGFVTRVKPTWAAKINLGDDNFLNINARASLFTRLVLWTSLVTLVFPSNLPPDPAPRPFFQIAPPDPSLERYNDEENSSRPRQPIQQVWQSVTKYASNDDSEGGTGDRGQARA